jgi:hypothetical protein
MVRSRRTSPRQLLPRPNNVEKTPVDASSYTRITTQMPSVQLGTVNPSSNVGLKLPLTTCSTKGREEGEREGTKVTRAQL